MIWFTADTHLGHTNIIKYCKRPFSSITEMDATIIKAINSRVQPNDTLYVVGDFCWKDKSAHYTSLIHCKNIVLVKGNHDNGQLVGFKEVHNYKEITVTLKGGAQKFVVLFHYPIAVWNKAHYGSWHLTGHCHGNHSGSNDKNTTRYCLDVGVDSHNYAPLSIYDIAAIMDKKNWENPREKWRKEGTLYKETPVSEEELDGGNRIVEECCSCHINPPCSYCTDKSKIEE